MKKLFIFIIMLVGVVFGGILGGVLGGIGGSSGNAWAENMGGSGSAYDGTGGGLNTGGGSGGGGSGGVSENLPDIYIKAVNPGYTVDGVQNVGEMIEIGRKNSDTPISLAGYNIYYTNSSGNKALLADLSKYIWMTGETFILSLASSPGGELAPVQYTKTLAFKAGPLTLERDAEVVDSVCWTGKDGCFAAFNSANPTSLVRNLTTGEFGHLSSYNFLNSGVLVFNSGSDNDGLSGENVEKVSQCKGVVFSEILSYYESLQSEQFIELYNNGVESAVLDGCYIKYKNKKYSLSGMIKTEGYFVRYLTDFKLTKNPTTSNVLELVDADGTVVDKLEYFNGQRKGTSYALIGYDTNGAEIWKVTYAPTPGEPNNYQEYRTCEVGKVINEATGNCVKVTSLAEKICGEGKYLNILTGRCRKISDDSGGTKECKEGYYRNEETGRCRKIKENKGADYALVPETYKEESSFVALYLILGVVLAGGLYVGYEFRHEILKFFRKIKGRF